MAPLLDAKAIESVAQQMLPWWDQGHDSLANTLQRLTSPAPYVDCDAGTAEQLDECMVLLLTENELTQALGLMPVGEPIDAGLVFELAAAAQERCNDAAPLWTAAAAGRRLGQVTVDQPCGYALFSALETRALATSISALLQAHPALETSFLKPVATVAQAGCMLAIASQ